MADIVFMGVTITPNPVDTKGTFKISADIRPKIFVLDAGDGTALDTGDGSALETE